MREGTRVLGGSGEGDALREDVLEAALQGKGHGSAASPAPETCCRWFISSASSQTELGHGEGLLEGEFSWSGEVQKGQGATGSGSPRRPRCSMPKKCPKK